jgi:hypothetical protein
MFTEDVIPHTMGLYMALWSVPSHTYIHNTITTSLQEIIRSTMLELPPAMTFIPNFVKLVNWFNSKI